MSTHQVQVEYLTDAQVQDLAEDAASEWRTRQLKYQYGSAIALAVVKAIEMAEMTIVELSEIIHQPENYINMLKEKGIIS